MKQITHAIELGATMYIPATNANLWDVTQGLRYPELRSIVVCLEDAVLEKDIQLAMLNLKKLLLNIEKNPKLNQSVAIFIRPRHPEMAKHIIDWQLQHTFNGFVIPKFTLANLETWKKLCPAHLVLMPTLETAEYFDSHYIAELKNALKYDFPPVLCLRIGGNDLMSCLNLRRPRQQTLYETPIGHLIPQLVGQLIPAGFSLSAPTFEHFENIELFEREIALDHQSGLFTKTVIHPTQIEIVHRALKVDFQDFQDAKMITDVDAKSVFKQHGSMLEPATHLNWAKMILKRAELFGIESAPHLPEDEVKTPHLKLGT